MFWMKIGLCKFWMCMDTISQMCSLVTEAMGYKMGPMEHVKHSQIVKDRDEDMNHHDLVLTSQFCMEKCTPKGVKTIKEDLQVVTIENYHVSYQGNFVNDHVTLPPT